MTNLHNKFSIILLLLAYGTEIYSQIFEISLNKIRYDYCSAPEAIKAKLNYDNATTVMRITKRIAIDK